MQNTKLLLTSLTLVGLLALAGCSFPGVYKIDIQQGNVVTQDMIDQLRPGMTRRQVRFIMGNPLIQTPSTPTVGITCTACSQAAANASKNA